MSTILGELAWQRHHAAGATLTMQKPCRLRWKARLDIDIPLWIVYTLATVRFPWLTLDCG